MGFSVGFFVLKISLKATIRKKGLHWDAEVDEAEIAKLFQMEDSNQKL